MRKKIIYLLSILLLIPLFTACDKSQAEPTKDPLAVVYTSVASTMSAEQKKPAITSTPLATSVLQTVASAPTVDLTSQPTPMPVAESAGNATSCTLASAYVSDVTYADGSYVYPGLTFTKTWLLQNTGTCTWSTSYQVVYVSGNQMSGSTVYLAVPVANGKQIQVSITMVAPTTEGTYKGYWRLANESGTPFGATFYASVISSTSASTLTPTATSSSATSTPTSTSTTAASTATTAPTATTQPTETTEATVPATSS